MHSFPPPAPIWPAVIIALPLGAVGVWMFNGKRKSRPSDAVVWFVAGVVLNWSYLAMAMRMPRTEAFENTVHSLLWLSSPDAWRPGFGLTSSKIQKKVRRSS